MPTPPRRIERLTAQRAAEIPSLLERLDVMRDLLELAAVYAGRAQAELAGSKLEQARANATTLLEELNTFRAPAKRGEVAEPAAGENGGAE